MFNMHSVIEIDRPGTALVESTPKINQARVRELTETMLDMMSMSRVEGILKREQKPSGTVSELGVKTASDVVRLTVEHAMTTGAVFPALSGAGANQFFAPVLDRAHLVAQTPRVKLQSLRALADNLGFMLTPFEFLNPDSYAEESKAVQGSIKAFDEALGGACTIYALAPIGYYDFGRHLASKRELELYAPERHRQTIEAVQMIMPVLREMKSEIRQNGDQVRTMKSRIDKLEARVEQERAERIAAETRRSLRVQDPMLFAVPSGVDITSSKGLALVGPCWGPDMEDILTGIFNLKASAEQRRAIEGSLNRLLKPFV